MYCMMCYMKPGSVNVTEESELTGKNLRHTFPKYTGKEWYGDDGPPDCSRIPSGANFSGYLR